MTKLPKSFREQWLAALRSGEFKQTQTTLVRDGKYCCLGVAGRVCGLTDDRMVGQGDIAGLVRTGVIEDNHPLAVALYYDGEMHMDTSVAQILDTNVFVTRLVNMNDHESKTFNEIADYIEAMSEGI